jgi:hypothetical protein
MQDVTRHALEVPWAKESPKRGKEADDEKATRQSQWADLQ